MTRTARLGLVVSLVLLACAVVLYRASPLETRRLEPGLAPEYFQDLSGEWAVTVRMRDAAEAPWREFQTSASIEPLFGGQVLRERPLDTSKPWRELAFTRWDAASALVIFEHVFSGSFSMLQMKGTFDARTRTISYVGEWHRVRDGDAVTESASGKLVIESHDRHVWRLDEYREDGSSFVDLEMIYERRD